MAETTTEGVKRKIVIGMDGSESSENAFKWYVDSVWQEGDYVFAVYTPEFKSLTHVSTISADVAMVQKIIDDETAHAKTLMKKITSLLSEFGVKGAAMQSTGDPGEQIVSVATAEDANLIITGCRGLGTFRRTFLGSVSDYVVHHAQVPVLVYKPPQQ